MRINLYNNITPTSTVELRNFDGFRKLGFRIGSVTTEVDITQFPPTGLPSGITLDRTFLKGGDFTLVYLDDQQDSLFFSSIEGSQLVEKRNLVGEKVIFWVNHTRHELDVGSLPPSVTETATHWVANEGFLITGIGVPYVPPSTIVEYDMATEELVINAGQPDEVRVPLPEGLVATTVTDASFENNILSIFQGGDIPTITLNFAEVDFTGGTIKGAEFNAAGTQLVFTRQNNQQFTVDVTRNGITNGFVRGADLILQRADASEIEIPLPGGTGGGGTGGTISSWNTILCTTLPETTWTTLPTHTTSGYRLTFNGSVEIHSSFGSLVAEHSLQRDDYVNFRLNGTDKQYRSNFIFLLEGSN